MTGTLIVGIAIGMVCGMALSLLIVIVAAVRVATHVEETKKTVPVVTPPPGFH